MSLLLLMDDAFSPRSLFAAGEQGIWLDPSDFSSMFQDSAGTTPVTALGQPVGKILDKSGRGNHATQATAASRPILQQDSNGKYYLSFDGVDDGMATASINFTGTDKMTVIAGVRKASSVGTQCLIELSVSKNVNAGVFAVFSPLTNGADSIAYTSKGTTEVTVEPLLFPVGSYVFTGSSNISTDSHIIRKNGAQASTSNSDQGTGNYGNYPLYIGRRGGASLSFNGRLYGLIVRGAASNAGQIAQAEQYMNSKTRAY